MVTNQPTQDSRDQASSSPTPVITDPVRLFGRDYSSCDLLNQIKHARSYKAKSVKE
jgi:hypothetical protein